MFEELLKRLGVPPESWIVSTLVAALMIIYRVFEPDEPVSRSKTVRIVVAGLICTVLFPGLAVYYLKIQNPFFSAAATGLAVYCFEPLLKIAQGKFIKRASDGDK